MTALFNLQHLSMDGLFFFVIGVESLHDVLPKGLLAEIPLFELPFVLRHELSERAKEAKVQNICIG